MHTNRVVPKSMTNRKRKHFTLIELFVVMVIIVILLAILLPLYERMGAGSRVNSAARLIGSQLGLARQLTQSKQRHVALIMPAHDATQNLPEEYWFSIYRLAYVTEGGNAPNDFTWSGWVEDSKWFFTPKGCTIMEADEDKGIQYWDGAQITWFPIPEDNNFIRVENVEIGKPLLDTVVFLDQVRAIVYGPNGKLKPQGAFKYITIGEAEPLWNGVLLSWNLVNQVATSTNVSCANQITVEINGFTGGISYETPDKY